KELIRGVDRAKNVTVVALHQAVVLANSLADQKIIMTQVQALNDMTSDMILRTSKMIGVQGAEINKQASSTMLDADKLKEAFVELNKAIVDIEEFRGKALPEMKKHITHLEDLSTTGRDAIKRFEKGNVIDLNIE
ncbi:MAG: toxic anion resistance protein, partial [Anaeroplasmataceae bacterium]